MIEFLKNIVKQLKFKSDNEELNKLNKLIYSLIILCAFVFIGFILYFAIRELPNLMEAIRYNWNDSKSVLDNFSIK